MQRNPTFTLDQLEQELTAKAAPEQLSQLTSQLENLNLISLQLNPEQQAELVDFMRFLFALVGLDGKAITQVLNPNKSSVATWQEILDHFIALRRTALDDESQLAAYFPDDMMIGLSMPDDFYDSLGQALYCQYPPVARSSKRHSAIEFPHLPSIAILKEQVIEHSKSLPTQSIAQQNAQKAYTDGSSLQYLYSRTKRNWNLHLITISDVDSPLNKEVKHELIASQEVLSITDDEEIKKLYHDKANIHLVLYHDKYVPLINKHIYLDFINRRENFVSRLSYLLYSSTIPTKPAILKTLLADNRLFLTETTNAMLAARMGDEQSFSAYLDEHRALLRTLEMVNDERLTSIHYRNVQDAYNIFLVLTLAFQQARVDNQKKQFQQLYEKNVQYCIELNQSLDFNEVALYTIKANSIELTQILLLTGLIDLSSRQYMLKRAIFGSANPAFIRLLEPKQLNLQAIDNVSGNTILHDAILEECTDVMFNTLLEYELPSDNKNRQSLTPLQLAILLKQNNKAENLLQNKKVVASINVCDPHGETALDVAFNTLRDPHHPLIKLIIASGGTFASKINNGLYFAIKNKSQISYGLMGVASSVLAVSMFSVLKGASGEAIAETIKQTFTPSRLN